LSSSLLAAAVALREALSGFEPGVYPASDCARLAEELARTEKACAGVRLLAARRAVEAGAHREMGFSDGASWLARQSGSTGAAAREALRTAGRLEDCADTAAALVAGEISLAQAAEIAAAESDTSGAEAELLPLARTCDLSQLRDHARDHLQSRTDAAELRRRHLAARELRHWRDREGMVRFAGALPPDTGLPFVRRLEAGALRLRRKARSGGAPAERFEAYAADALVGLVAGAGAEETPERPAGAELVIVCDLYAWRRGHAQPGEACHIIGGGPIPVEVARQLSQDAFLKVALHDGVEIRTVKHFGRHLPAALRTALDLGPVPEFSGRACVECGSRFGLEYDHVDPLANHGPTEYANLEPRCYKDHAAKTERDRRAGLLGPYRARAPNAS
jgi:Domain of unknown function (DUF222)/HNH endonuclease